MNNKSEGKRSNNGNSTGKSCRDCGKSDNVAGADNKELQSKKQPESTLHYTTEDALKFHEKQRGKIGLLIKVPVQTRLDLSLAYTPGVAEPCKVIHAEEIMEKKSGQEYSYSAVNKYTARGNTVAVVSDGTAVLGLGDIGPRAGLPVMEGKSLLFKRFANIDSYPLCLDTKDPDKLVEIIAALEPSFGGINMEDISAPRCFYIEEKAQERMNIPVFHDDQHGTAVVVNAALKNALSLVNKKFNEVKVVINGAGSAGLAISKLLYSRGVRNIILCDKWGAITTSSKEANPYQIEMTKLVNPENYEGDLKGAMKGADVFIGVSVANIVNKEMVQGMQKDAVVLAMANPVPEIMPELAKEAGARIVCTGRSDFPNQVNNVMGFPGIFRGALDVCARRITYDMKIAAADALASVIKDELDYDKVLPSPLDPRIVPSVALAVAKKACETGVARLKFDRELILKNLEPVNELASSLLKNGQ
ncbi:MAG: malic enzyme-like NAD(P)-binding protein [Thermoplasmata archaeon]